MSKSANRILIVDDDAMNRKLTTMFLKKLGYESRGAESGREALEAVKDERFLLILMDYRMPEMDGVETTRKLRGMEGVYFKEVPVIALTGDERDDVRREFTEAGMNGILQKPIDAKRLEEVLCEFLETDADKHASETCGDGCEQMADNQLMLQSNMQKEYAVLQAAGIHAPSGIQNCGSSELWQSFLADFYYLVDFKAEKLAKYLSEGQFREYTIEVHALKNSARLIGAQELSADFGQLEEWGNQGEYEKIVEKNPQILKKMLEYKKVLSPFADNGKETQAISVTQLKEVLWAMQSAAEAFDIDGVDFCMEGLKGYRVPGCDSQMDALRACVADVALEEILEIISNMIGIIEKAE